MGYDLRIPRSNVGEVLCVVSSSEMHRAAFSANNKHVVVVGSDAFIRVQCIE